MKDSARLPQPLLLPQLALKLYAVPIYNQMVAFKLLDANGIMLLKLHQLILQLIHQLIHQPDQLLTQLMMLPTINLI